MAVPSCLIWINEVSDAIYDRCRTKEYVRYLYSTRSHLTAVDEFVVRFRQDDEEYNVRCTENCSMGTPWFIKWLIRYGVATIKRWKARSTIDPLPLSVV